MGEAAAQTGSGPSGRPVVETLIANGTGPFVLACEHASNFVPPQFDDLGLAADTLQSHIAWDPGARQVALLLARHLESPLVASTVSRLVYDCNRAPMDDSATPARSETFDIPGNSALTAAEKYNRAQTYYAPFRTTLHHALDAKAQSVPAPVLVTVHTFTPVYFGRHRDVQIGILHDRDSRFADLLLDVMAGDTARYRIGRNDPYGPADGVTHTLRDHALPRGMLNVMIEIRNDLVATPADQASMARYLAERLTEAFSAAGGQVQSKNGKRPEGISHA